IAQQVYNLLAGAGITIAQDQQRGLDHGAWVPLKLMYPLADIPVTQLSIQSHSGPLAHYKMGQAIGALQDEGIMILCSGAITHNLHDFFTMQRDAPLLPYVMEFANWMAEKAASNDIDALLNYRKLAPHAVRAHPHEDHLVPLFVALGAARGAMKRYQPENTFGILAMDAYVWAD
ncbi:MAG TPA: class III extradiol ring-cleavage dioxygenase, partial [Methyloradius sp.]